MSDKERIGLAGNRLYVPPGGLKLQINADGTIDPQMCLAIDPWLPDLSTDAETPVDVILDIARQGFTVGSICSGKSINACQKTREVHELITHPEVARLRHMAVIDGVEAIGILDLDVARGQERYNDERSSLRVEEIYEPQSGENTLRGDSPLTEYILTADTRPFCLVELPGNKLGTVGIEDLQKVPVRILLFMHFIQLEDMLVRRLSEDDPEMLKQMKHERGVDAQPLGNSGSGPVRHIEPYGFRKLLQRARDRSILTLRRRELPFLERYRNALAHSPRWYITRRADVGSLVNCFKRVLELIEEARTHEARKRLPVSERVPESTGRMCLRARKLTRNSLPTRSE